MTVSGLWWRAWSTEAVRWVRATWELLPTAHLDGLCVRKRAKKIKLRQFFSFFSPPTRYITLEHHRLYSRLDVVWNVFFTFASFSLLCLSLNWQHQSFPNRLVPLYLYLIESSLYAWHTLCVRTGFNNIYADYSVWEHQKTEATCGQGRVFLRLYIWWEVSVP